MSELEKQGRKYINKHNRQQEKIAKGDYPLAKMLNCMRDSKLMAVIEKEREEKGKKNG